jgi:hypothetical protein
MACSRCNHFGMSLQSKPRNFRASLLHLIGHDVPVNVERGLDVTVPREFLLHCDRSPHSIQPGAVRVPEGMSFPL